MLIQRKVPGKTFQADQVGINKLKNDFFSEAREFVYFRKGEWRGVLDSIQHARDWAAANPEWVAISIAAYTPAKGFVAALAKKLGVALKVVRGYFCRPKPCHVTRRVICCTGIGKQVVRDWEAVCGTGSVVTIPRSQGGQFRYVLNEKRYAIFSRLGPNDLRGVIGTDRQTLRMLREMFDREFIEADLRKRRRRKRKS